MMKIKVSVMLIIFLLIFSSVFSQEKSQRQHKNIDFNWKFHFGHAADAQKDFNYTIANIFSKSGKANGTAIAIKFDDSSWRTLDLPHDWAVELPFDSSANDDVKSHGYKPVGGLYPETSVGWYRKHFILSPADSGSRFEIQFDGIFRDSEIWLNGFYLGNNKSGYIGIAYDITDYIHFDKENILVVRVDASQYEGWFYEGAGIYRHVWLNQFNNLHIDSEKIFIHNDKDDMENIQVEIPIKNLNFETVGYEITALARDRQGNVAGKSKSVAGNLTSHRSTLHKLNIPINDPHLWSLDDPYLYRITFLLTENGKETDQITIPFGIRKLQIDPEKGLFLNGKHIKIQGVNCHQDHAGVGSALPDYLQYYRMKLLKEMGVNAYRTSHNPPTPELLEACDSLGILVMDETRLLNSSPEYMDQFERLLYRDRNHPSIFMWSIGNEEQGIQTTQIGKRIALTMLTRQKQLDPTRTSTYAADVANVYPGINEVIPVRGFNYRQAGVAPYHKDHPEQPEVGTEMGSTVTTRGIYETDSLNGYVPDQDIIHPWWSSTAEEWWSLAAVNDFWMGGFIWTGFDYRGEPTPFQWPNINSHFGVMDMCGFPKNIYYYYQSWWTDKDVIHISPHWNWAGKEGENIKVWVNSNAETVELFLNGKSLGKKEMPRQSHLTWDVPYAPGTLEAIGYKNGKKLSSKIETTGEPFEIALKSDESNIRANGKDAAVINVTVNDKKGREVPDVNQMLHFKLTGPGKIIGVGNGDTSCHEPDKYQQGQYKRSLFNGKCQLILQAGVESGKVVVEATGTNLKTGEYQIVLE